MRILDAKGVTKCFGGLTAVNNVDFHIDTGEIVSLIGPNGAGKTTFFNSITGIYEPTSGEVEFLGEKVKKAKPYEITKLGIGRTFQNIRLFSTMTVMENIMVGQYCRTSSNLLATILKTPKLVKEEKMVIDKTHDIMEFLEISHLKDEIAISLPYGYQSYGNRS